MSRDEALKVWLPIIQMGVETMPECKEAFDMAVDTMRKYQKIEQIIDDWEHDVYPTSDDALDDVERVIEDGRN